jgi:hypothetical protein
MNEQLQQNIAEVYGKIIGPIDITKPYAVSFSGSQKPFELFTAWDIISELIDTDTPTFLEIGAFKGLWAIVFFEWCKLNNKKGVYVTVTWMEHNPDNNHLISVIEHYRKEGFECTLIDANSQIEETKVKASLSNGDKYDVVLIDADHRYDGSKKDIELYQPLAKTLVFHDIRPEAANQNCGVYQAIKDSGLLPLDHEIACGGDMMGIGIKFYE